MTRVSTKVLFLLSRNRISDEVNFAEISMFRFRFRFRYRNFDSAFDFDVVIPISVSKLYYQELNFYFSLKMDLKVRELLTVQ
jgi:hypothetical protein